jgi:hypothetical protein
MSVSLCCGGTGMARVADRLTATVVVVAMCCCPHKWDGEGEGRDGRRRSFIVFSRTLPRKGHGYGCRLDCR